jgi:lysozyme
MNPRLQVSRAAIELIERFEGYRRAAAQLDDGRWTIGYGHTKTARKGVEVSEADAEALLIYDLLEVAARLNEWVYTPLTQNQFDALAAFAFNIGLENFRQSAVLHRVNEGALLRAAFAMELWRKADFHGERIVVDALVRRRAAEKLLFLTPQDGFVPAPSAVLSPMFDRDFPGSAPAQTPVEVAARLNGDRAIAERVSPPPAITPAPPEADEEEPSASQVAAAALTARLQSILDDQAQPVTAHAAATVAAPSAEADEDESPPFDTFALSPPPPETLTPDPAPANPVEEAEIADANEPELFIQGPSAFEEFDSRQVAHHEFESFDDLAEVEPTRSFGPVPLLIALGVLGLILFSAGLFWLVSAKDGVNSGLFSSRMIVGGGLGIVGIGCVASAVYFLLERLGGREEQ